MMKNILFMLFAAFCIAACKHEPVNVHPGNILCGNQSKSWYYHQEDTINFCWMHPSVYTFDKSGDFSKVDSRYVEELKGKDMYDHQWELLNDSTLIIAGYKYTIKYISDEMVLLYNMYNGGTIDTLRQVVEQK